MVLRMKNVNILGVHWKSDFLGGGGVWETNIEGEIALKGGLDQFADLRVGGLITQCTLWYAKLIIVFTPNFEFFSYSEVIHGSKTLNPEKA